MEQSRPSSNSEIEELTRAEVCDDKTKIIPTASSHNNKTSFGDTHDPIPWAARFMCNVTYFKGAK